MGLDIRGNIQGSGGSIMRDFNYIILRGGKLFSKIND